VLLLNECLLLLLLLLLISLWTSPKTFEYTLVHTQWGQTDLNISTLTQKIAFIATIPWGRVHLEKLIVAQKVKKSLTFMEPKGSLPYSQTLTTGPYIEPDVSNLPPTMSWPTKCLLPSGFPNKMIYAFLISPCMLHVLPILPFLIS
jgi:hypothetical protein